jgi:hypothetical protein
MVALLPLLLAPLPFALRWARRDGVTRSLASRERAMHALGAASRRSRALTPL